MLLTFAGIISVLSVFYITPCDCTARDYEKTTTDVMLEQQIQTAHLQEFLENGQIESLCFMSFNLI